jgi:signal transduction histidine kinase
MFGAPLDGEVTLDTFYRALHPDDLNRVTSTWRYMLENALPFQLEYRLLRSDGSVRWIHARGSGYYDQSGRPLRMVGVVFDISKRKESEREHMELSGCLINAQEQERPRLAREIHDDFNQRLALLQIELRNLAEAGQDSPIAVPNRARDLQQIVGEINSDLHALSHRLYSPRLHVLGLAHSISLLCTDVSKQHGIQINFSRFDVPESIPSEAILCLFRIAQEGLLNVTKHSRASTAEVRLNGSAEVISLTLSDNGVGFDSSGTSLTDGIGIRSMRERARMVGGAFEVSSRAMHGTQITVTIPLKSAHAA